MNKYNPNIHHRRSIRLKGYDYSQGGVYFITICCENRKHRFGKITVGASLAGAQNKDAQMELNEFGTIAYNEWAKLPERFLNFESDVFQIMPNHMHGIIILNDVGAGFIPAAQNDNMVVQNANVQKEQPQGISPTNKTIGDMVGAYKSLVSNGCLEICKIKNKTMGKLWQRNYHEHIIRNEQSYQNISDYIINNPSKWNDDKFFTK